MQTIAIFHVFVFQFYEKNKLSLNIWDYIHCSSFVKISEENSYPE